MSLIDLDPGRRLTFLPKAPLVTVIVPHMNYSAFIEDALLSVLGQTYDRWDCVVVDDHSSEAHRDKLRTIVESLGSERIRVIWNDENLGQIPAFFTGLEATSGPFVTALDPDDRLASTFIEECVRAHLNQTTYAPLVSTDQSLIRDGNKITGSFSGFHRQYLRQEGGDLTVPKQLDPLLVHIPRKFTGWHWTTTSAMMFRRSALELLRPHKRLAYKRVLDAYLAPAVHQLGGTLYLTKPLVYRSIHEGNSYITSKIVSTQQEKRKKGGEQRSDEALRDALEAIVVNGGRELLAGSAD